MLDLLKNLWYFILSLFGIGQPPASDQYIEDQIKEKEEAIKKLREERGKPIKSVDGAIDEWKNNKSER